MAAGLVAAVLVVGYVVGLPSSGSGQPQAGAVTRGPLGADESPGPDGQDSPALGRSRSHGTPERVRPATAAGWATVLAAIDSRRQRAWHLGDPSALAAVFVPGSRALAADQRALRGYLSRGIHVDGVSTSYRVLAVEAATSRSATLLVVDRLGQAVARDASGRSASLPRDRPTRQHITVQLVHGRWRIASVVTA